MHAMINAEEVLRRLKNQTINYDKVLRKMIVKWEAQKDKPTILLHSCCAPCSTSTLEFLCQHAEVTIFFSNSNIHPKSEYQRRAHEQKRFIDQFNERTGHQAGFIEDEYRPEVFTRMVMFHQLAEEEEGGERCSALTLSPKKNSQLINELGLEVQQLYDVNYLPSDFKKNKGYERSIVMCREYDVYRQCYCGCVFAAKQQGVDLREVNKEALAYLKDKHENWDKISFNFGRGEAKEAKENHD